MDEELLRRLLVTFADEEPRRPEYRADRRALDDHLVIRGYLVPYESPVEDGMLSVLAQLRTARFAFPGPAGQ